jgi:hypothetical protein
MLRKIIVSTAFWRDNVSPCPHAYVAEDHRVDSLLEGQRLTLSICGCRGRSSRRQLSGGTTSRVVHLRMLRKIIVSTAFWRDNVSRCPFADAAKDHRVDGLLEGQRLTLSICGCRGRSACRRPSGGTTSHVVHVRMLRKICVSTAFLEGQRLTLSICGCCGRSSCRQPEGAVAPEIAASFAQRAFWRDNVSRCPFADAAEDQRVDSPRGLSLQKFAQFAFRGGRE